MARFHALSDGPVDWGAVFSNTGESEPDVPGAPKRAGSSSFDYWWKDCGRIVSVRSETLSQYSTRWTRDLAKWTRQAERAEQREILRSALDHARSKLDVLSVRLKETAVGKKIHAQRKTAEMNARYVYRNGKRKYVGKKVVAARKAKRAAAARARRTREWAKSHGVDLATAIQLSQ